MSDVPQAYKVKTRRLPGTHFPRLLKKAFGSYKEIKRKSKRRPYVRSAYFDKQKIFFELFWHHLHEKNLRDKARRVAYFCCAIELIQNSRLKPISKENPNRKDEILHRFAGMTPDQGRSKEKTEMAYIGLPVKQMKKTFDVVVYKPLPKAFFNCIIPHG